MDKRDQYVGGELQEELISLSRCYENQNRSLVTIAAAAGASQVVTIHVAAKRDGECPQARHRCEHRVTHG
jgi:hypothetical protein